MLDRRIESEVVGVVTILVTECDLVNPLAKLLAAVVAPTLGMAVVYEQRGEPLGHTEPIVGLSQQQDAAIGRDVGCVGGEHERFALELKLDR